MTRPAARARLLALVIALTGTCAAAAPAPPPLDAARLDRLIAAAGFNGEVIVGRTDAIVYQRAVGSVSPGVPQVIGARWRWASVTKQLTALLVMQEVAAGTIDLDTPVATYWPEWRAPHAREITIRMLLRHESGLADPAEDSAGPDGVPDFYRATGDDADPDAHAAGFCADRPRAAPPAGFHYDNCDFLVLGRVLERVTGVAYPQLVRDRIARPLGLDDVGVFRWDAPEPVGVIGYDAVGIREPAINLGIYGAAGGAYGSPAALWRIDRALLRGELLDRVATAAMWTGEPRLGYAALGAWSFPAPIKGCPDPVRLVERRGEIGGIEIRNFILPDQASALILFTNRQGFAFGEVWQQAGLSHDLLAAIACPAPATGDAPVPPPAAAAAPPAR